MNDFIKEHAPAKGGPLFRRQTVSLLASFAPYIFAFCLGIGWWLISSHFESKTYNSLTGAHTTMWDAMWVNLRVQDKPTQ